MDNPVEGWGNSRVGLCKSVGLELVYLLNSENEADVLVLVVWNLVYFDRRMLLEVVVLIPVLF